MEIIQINDYLSFILEPKRAGYKITAIYEGESIGSKKPCKHHGCIIQFIAEFTLVAKQMKDMENVFEPDFNLN